MTKEEKLVTSLSRDERAALALGFYNFDTFMQSEVDNWDENAPTSQPYRLNVPSSGVVIGGAGAMSSFNAGDTSADSRGSVNGAWAPIHDYGRTDNFVDDDTYSEFVPHGWSSPQPWGEYDVNSDYYDEFIDDNDYEYFLTKKSRARRKKRKELRKGGMTRSQARVQARKEIPKDSLKTIAKKSFKRLGSNLKKVVHVVKVGSLYIPRQSFRGLLALNYRGLASRLDWIKNNDSSMWDKVKKKWKALGGAQKYLDNSINKGKGKKMLFCFKACQAKHNQKYVKKNFSGAAGVVIDKNTLYADLNEAHGYSNAVCAGACIVASYIASAAVIIQAILGLIGKVGENKAMKEETQRMKDRDEKELELMAKQQDISKQELEARIDKENKAIQNELSPINQIMQNPDLSPEEKKLAAAEVEKALATKGGREINKYLIMGAIGIVGLFVFGKMLKK